MTNAKTESVTDLEGDSWRSKHFLDWTRRLYSALVGPRRSNTTTGLPSENIVGIWEICVKRGLQL